MPGYTTHWLVAIRAIDDTPDYASNGYDKYKRAVNILNESLTRAIANILKSNASVSDFTKEEGGFDKILRTFDKAINGIKNKDGEDQVDPKTHDDITCFSAYMLGACGPDFWMMPSHGGGRAPLNMGAHHFDLGHYNRTHRVFNAISESRRTLRWQRRRHPRRICNTPRRLLLAAWISSLIEKWRMKGCVGLSVNSAGLERSYA